MDKSHDKHVVNQFIATTIDHLKKKYVTINEIIEFTDHASSQYKSRFTFYYMTLLDVPCTLHYFGVKHGKGPSDHAGANFKCKIRSAVRAGKFLLSADAIAEYCMENFDCQIGCGSDERDVNERDINEHDVIEHDVNEKQESTQPVQGVPPQNHTTAKERNEVETVERFQRLLACRLQHRNKRCGGISQF